MSKIEFLELYTERSKYPRQIKTSDGKVWIYNPTNRCYEEVRKVAEDYVVEFIVKGQNILHTKWDVQNYEKFIRTDVLDCLGVKFYNRDFAKLEQLIKYIANESLGDKVKAGNNINVIDSLDQASGGGVLIAEKGTYEGEYHCFDINNSYNKFFTDFANKIPTNPKFKTVDKVLNKTFAIYRMTIGKEYLTKEHTMKFKTNRKWFTKFDLDIFDIYGIKYELLQQKNNCIVYDKVECNFDWINKLNQMKQKINKNDNPIKYNILKELLSSFWGQISKYKCVSEEEYGAVISNAYYHKVGAKTGDRLYIHPDQIFKYNCGVLKPFVLAYARLRLLKQIHKIEKKGYKIIYSHTDSIITNAPAKYFDIGTNIGQYKLEKSGEKITIENIAQKYWF